MIPVRTSLSRGGTVALIAASGPVPLEWFQHGVKRLSRHYDVRYDPRILERDGFFAGSERRRAHELQAAIDDPSVDAIIAARGGYGATRLLPQLDLSALATHPKLLVGFSDVTALHAQWARAGLCSLHASMVIQLGRMSEPRFARFKDALEGALPPLLEGLTPLRTGSARGRLVGGNLSVLCALLATPFAPPLENTVLFLEDTKERPYRIDRMLTTLQQAGWLSRVNAVVLGAFSDAEPGPDGIAAEQVLRERLGALDVPVLAGVPAGHVDDNLELPLGCMVSVDATKGTLRFEEEA